jgi:hypothetical protein
MNLRSAVLALSFAIIPCVIEAQSVDHSTFDGLLRRHVVSGMVDYDAFAVAPEFPGYLQLLARTDPTTLPRDERLAFWINAYNAYTIALINKHGERKSIRNINRALGLFKGLGPWNEKIAVIGGTAYGLDHIEQKIIRPEFGEPRIHFALVCAAIGCPPLRSEAYTAPRLDAQLDDQARIFLLQSPEKNRVDVATGTVYVSNIFSFNDYEKDFGGSKQGVARFIARYHPAGPARELLESGRWKRWVVTEYDWGLNGR